MSSVLVLNSSVSGDASVSRQLVEETLSRLRAESPGLRVVIRDLAENPVPHLTAASVSAFAQARPADPAQAEARALSDRLIAELQAADTLVIGAPMYNFGIPSTLKAWFDHVLRAGITFRYTEAGSEGLLQGKRAIVLETRGGLYTEGTARALDAQEPHLRALLGFMGINDVTFVRAERLALGADPRAQGIAEAKAALAQLGATLARRAA